MKTNIPFAMITIAMIVLVSCKKDNSPANTDPELLGPETNKVFHYSFNGSLNDGSGSNLHPTDSNNIAYTNDRFGRTNQAALFGSNGNISTILTPSLSAKITGFPMAVSFWFKSENVSNMQCIAKSDGFERNTYSGFTVYLGAWGANKLSFAFANNTGRGGSSYFTIVSPEIITANNTWYHALINIRSANDYDFYVNGVQYTNCTTNGSASTIAFNPPSVGIMGLYDGTPTTSFRGALDDYRIYTKSLSQQEVAALYNFQP